MSLHDTSDDCESDASSVKEADMSDLSEVNNYAVVRIKGNKGCKNYIALIVCGPDSDDDYEVKFMKRCERIHNGFVLSDEDPASVHSSDVIVHIEKPERAASTKRLSNVWKFKDNIVNFYSIA